MAELTPEQIGAIKQGLATAPKIQKDLKAEYGYGENIFFDLDLIEYRITKSLPKIAEDLDVKSRYGLKAKVAENSVGLAFRGHHDEDFKPDYQFEGLFSEEMNDIIEGIRYEKGGQATIETHGDQMSNGGRKLADMINPETEERYVVEAGRIGGRKSNEAQGNHLWSLEEIADIGELKYGEGLTWNDTTSEMNEKYGGDWSTSKVRDAYRKNKHRLPDEEE